MAPPPHARHLPGAVRTAFRSDHLAGCGPRALAGARRGPRPYGRGFVRSGRRRTVPRRSRQHVGRGARADRRHGRFLAAAPPAPDQAVAAVCVGGSRDGGRSGRDRAGEGLDRPHGATGHGVVRRSRRLLPFRPYGHRRGRVRGCPPAAHAAPRLRITGTASCRRLSAVASCGVCPYRASCRFCSRQPSASRAPLPHEAPQPPRAHARVGSGCLRRPERGRCGRPGAVRLPLAARRGGRLVPVRRTAVGPGTGPHASRSRARVTAASCIDSSSSTGSVSVPVPSGGTTHRTPEAARAG